jgi:lipopolysaccharide biosynthesis glycosyltransferase
MKICYLISQDYLSLTLSSIDFVKKFYKCREKLEFVIFHFGDLEDVPIPGIIKKKIPSLNYPFFIHRCLMFDEFDEKVIFLDSDTICLTDISRLYNIDLENNMLGVSQHNWLITHSKAFTNYKPTDALSEYVTKDDFPFFNAGVMVVDCVLWKKIGATKQVFDFFELYRGEWYQWNDEVALNCLFGRNNCKFVDKRWNYNEREFGKPYIKHYYGFAKKLDT